MAYTPTAELDHANIVDETGLSDLSEMVGIAMTVGGAPSLKKSLCCLVYVSRLAPVTGKPAEQLVREILNHAWARNALNEVTGILVFNKMWFIQALEGPFTAIEETYNRIMKDKRHSDCRVVYKQPVSVRSFGEWTMCARQLSKLDNHILDSVEKYGGLPNGPAAGRLLLDQLQKIGQVHKTNFDRQLGLKKN